MMIFVMIMFFAIVGCPSPGDLAPKAITSNIATKYSDGVHTASDDNPSPVPEPIALVLLGPGLVGPSVIGRIKFKK